MSQMSDSSAWSIQVSQRPSREPEANPRGSPRGDRRGRSRAASTLRRAGRRARSRARRCKRRAGDRRRPACGRSARSGAEPRAHVDEPACPLPRARAVGRDRRRNASTCSGLATAEPTLQVGHDATPNLTACAARHHPPTVLHLRSVAASSSFTVNVSAAIARPSSVSAITRHRPGSKFDFTA